MGITRSATPRSAGIVAPWRITRTLAVSGGATFVAAIWFSIGLIYHTPPLLGWLTLLVSVPVAAASLWRAAEHGRTFWRYTTVGVVLVASAESATPATTTTATETAS